MYNVYKVYTCEYIILVGTLLRYNIYYYKPQQTLMMSFNIDFESDRFRTIPLFYKFIIHVN